MTGPRLCFVTPSGATATLGTFGGLSLDRLRYYVRRYQYHWVVA